jgi:hypothetical protein
MSITSSIPIIGHRRYREKRHVPPEALSIIGGYRQVGMPITENIGNLGKLKDAVTLKRSILTAKPDIEGRDFYPLLAEVGKLDSQVECWLAHRARVKHGRTMG